jgi:acyl-CoA synthetase (NDP forming)
VVLKAQCPGLAHKTELGLVAIGVAPGAVPEAYSLLTQRAREAGLDPESVLIEAMAADGVETIVGVVDDPVFGPVLMLGAGGVLVEAERRVAFRAIPLDVRDVEEMIEETGVGLPLDGYRGGPAHDRDALIAAVLAVSGYAERNAQWLSGVEINPLRVLARGEGVLALDALIELQGHDAASAHAIEPEARLRALTDPADNAPEAGRRA